MVTHDPHAAERAKRTLHLEKGLLLEETRHEVPPLLWSSLWRKKFRTIFTLLSIFVAFLLFGLLMTIRTAFTFGVDIAGLDRLVLIHKVSLIMPLPVSLPRAAAGHRGRDAGHAQHVVRRRLSGPVELLRADRGRARAVPEDLSGVQAAARADDGVAGRSAGRHRRRRSREAVRLEDRRSHSDPGHDLAAEAGPGLGIQHRRHLRRRRRASTRRSSSSATTTSTRTGAGRGPGRLVHRQDRRPVAGAGDGREVRRDVRQLLGRDQDDDREGLRRGLRQAGRRHRRDHDRDSRRRAVHDAAGRRQHDGAVGARAHERGRRAQDAGLLERRRSWRWCSANRC